MHIPCIDSTWWSLLTQPPPHTHAWLSPHPNSIQFTPTPDIWAALSIIGNMCASVEAFIVPGCIALALRGLWPNAPKAPGHDSSNEGGAGAGPANRAAATGGGGGGEEGEFSPLLLDGQQGSVAVAGSSSWQPPRQPKQQWRRRWDGWWLASSGWGRAEAGVDVGLAVLAIGVGCALVANGIVQPLLSAAG